MMVTRAFSRNVVWQTVVRPWVEDLSLPGAARRTGRRRLWAASLAGLLMGSTAALGEADGEARFFRKQVEPILQKRCYECHSHGAGKAKGGLVLDVRSGWELGGDSGPAVVPGRPADSLLIEAIGYAKADFQMPPDGRLPEAEIALLEEWVSRGAPDPRQGGETVEDVGLDKEGIAIEAGRRHWAFQPITRPPVPLTGDASWPLQSIDAFVWAGLHGAGITPSEEADRSTWLRRLHLDLTGLPPQPDEILAFLGDGSENAAAREADRLLASPAFGERWGRHWLDLTGYADQVGTANNVAATEAWRYRDYLIGAFNGDKPFDRFIEEQVAGDLLPGGSPHERAEAVVATGFLLLGDIDIANSDKEQMRVDVVDQQVSKVGTAFLGMTLGCARCHDHKFDPIPVEDYYALAGIFHSSESTYKSDRGVWSMVRTSDLPETEEQVAERGHRTREHRERLQAWKTERAEGRARLATLAPDNPQRGEIEGRLGVLDRQIEHGEFFAPTVPQAIAVRDSDQPEDMRITIRGNPHALGKAVPRGFLQVATYDEVPEIGKEVSGRLELAAWITSTSNPLTARVTVNRFWQKLFGQGLVRSVDYFGVRGEGPTHPELLDHLATRFVGEWSWSPKRLIRELILSRTYRLGGSLNVKGASLDPDNRLLWRMPPQRLEAEAIRDALLAVTGELHRSAGGPALALDYPENVSGLDPGNVNPPAFSLARYRPGQTLGRTVYLPILRSGAQPEPAEVRNLFDFAQPAEIIGQRPVTAVPPQALFLLNSAYLKERAEALARRTDPARRGEEKGLRELWLLVYGRVITEKEAVEVRQFLQALPEDVSGWKELCHALLASNEFLMRL